MDEIHLYLNLIRELTSKWSGLPDKPQEIPETTLRSLWLLAAGQQMSAENSIMAGLPELSIEEIERLRELINLRIDGIPLAHLTKRQTFMGIEMLAGSQALIPRFETEILGYSALTLLKELVRERRQVTIIDLCTGSGNLALAMAHYEPNCIVIGSDISEEAVELATQNAVHLGLSDRVKFVVGDLFEPFENEQYMGKVDMLLCNPPYISSTRVDELPSEISAYEPREAFDGGPFGVSVMMALIKSGPALLKPNSWLGFEVGLGQGEAMKRKIQRNGMVDKKIKEYCDQAGNIRALFVLTNHR